MHNPSRSRRHVIASISIGALLALGPMLPTATPVSADAPAVAVTGLSRGARGEAVKSVQSALVNQGLNVAGGVDGIFGPGTESALKTFQQQQGLNASGVVDDATAIALGLASSSFLGLTQGNRGDAVKQLQQRLVNAGITVTGGVDGIFGPGTQSAVKAFQKQQGYSPTGVVNAATAAALEALDGSAEAPAAEAPETDDHAGESSLVGLKIGARGELVVQLQQTLMDAGFTVVGGADGVFGALTANALKSFQNANALATSGVVDAETAAVLASLGAHDQDHDHDPSASNPFIGLQYGSLGADVKALQSALIDAGINVRGGADGVFGTATQDAVKQFQASQGLSQTGKVDEQTASAISSGATVTGTSAFAGLKAGALGNTVKGLQQALLDAGINVRGGADGIFGPATANAVKEFQSSQGLEATGVVDAKTAAALADPKPTTSQPASEGGFAQYGEKGDRVVALQSALVKAGITLRGGVDGDFGGGTSAAVMDFQRANGLSVTGKVTDATAAKLGLQRMPEPTAPDVSSVQLDVFPVQGKCYYGDTWHYSRSGGRLHLGVDIITSQGKLIYAVADGTITKVYTDYPGSLSGNGVRLTMADGTYFFYAHMVAVADGIDVGTKVKAGQIVGQVGSTGNSGTPHLHFEVHPQGGAAVNPYPIVKAIDDCGNETPLPQP
jgi:peptidoglycan hydrolase-like protein with peptidoglycan-binding domain